jgi:aspartate carbamoyltransferase catalytic subunit
MMFKHRHVLDLDVMDPADIHLVLETTDQMKEILARPIRRIPPLRGKTVVNLFFEASTRTRVSFELAAKNLSADVVNVSSSGSSVEKGESLIDTINTLQALGSDAIVMRHSQAGAPYIVAQHLDRLGMHGSVINAGDGWHAHPTQALLDLYTIRERRGDLRGLTCVIVGDILHSRVARSNVWAMTRMGMRVVLCGPATMMPALNGKDQQGLPSVEVVEDLDRAIADADIVMALRIQKERQTAGLMPSVREYIRLYQISRKRLESARPDIVVMHPGPMNEGVEIAPDVATDRRAVIEQQVTNGVAVRMALLYLLAGESSGAL